MVKKIIRNTIAIEIDQNPGLIWETIKLNVRTETIRYSSRKKSKIITLEALERRLSRIQTRFENNPTDEDKTDIDLIKQDKWMHH